LFSGQFVKIPGVKKVGRRGGVLGGGLPRVPIEPEPVVVEVADGDVLLVGTDRIGDPLGSGHGGVGNLLRNVLTRPRAPSRIDLAQAVDFSREKL
jgi:hypothetical protein